MNNALENVDRISFVVEVLTIRNGRKLGRIRPDQDGYYTVPLAVLGTPTDNRTYYEVNDFVNQLTSPDSYINKCLVDAKLFGEYGHPMIKLLPENLQLPRLMLVDEKNHSHHIKKIWTGEKLESGGRIIYGLIKPTGPFGSYLRDSLEDPCLNTSFSLRSIAHSTETRDLIRRKIKYLVTFDFVGAGGYSEATKRYAPAVEVLVDLPITHHILQTSHAAMEHLSNTELNEIFGAKIVTIGSKQTSFVPEKQALCDERGTLQSVFTRLMNTSV